MIRNVNGCGITLGLGEVDFTLFFGVKKYSERLIKDGV
jgi:hypothetical protein